MRYLIIFFILHVLVSCSSTDQLLQSAGDLFDGISNDAVTQEEAGLGLKEALFMGIKSGATNLSKTGGYMNALEYRLSIPPEAQIIEDRLRSIGLNEPMDRVVQSINHAAEEAAKNAIPIFESAITSLSFADALAIVTGEKNAATEYLKEKTYAQLVETYKSPVKQALDKVNATAYWGEIMNRYNRIPLVEKVNPDLEAYVTAQALDGLFKMVAKEELAIRTDPVKRSTNLLKRVFRLQDS